MKIDALTICFSSVVATRFVQAHELGTPLSASFEGFGADKSGRLSVQQLHAALKDIGQFRWTTVSYFQSLLSSDLG